MDYPKISVNRQTDKIKHIVEEGIKIPEVQKHSSTLSLTWALDEAGLSRPGLGCFTPGKKTLHLLCTIPCGPRTGQDVYLNLAPVGIRSPNRPARSESLCQLRALGDTKMWV
jgi:hypothetical protein